ncbi:MAG: TonB-dependent receptor [Bryobacteraceae bacterium]|nr:TonB-dependent receptor [Bryobacteraceae bacterium]
MRKSIFIRLAAVIVSMSAGIVLSQSPGRIEGQVVLARTGDPVHAASVHLVELNRTASTNHEGRFTFENVPPGAYNLDAHADVALTEISQAVTVKPGETTTAKLELNLATLRQQVTVTASGKTESTFDAFQSVDSRDSFDLAQQIAPSLGETLANQPGNGIAKRSFGPGTERPIIRGFDGDRVLILQDGIRTGTLSSQSGDHGESINTGTLDRLEVVKGPGTLLYGGNALGGTVNAITRHHAFHEHPHGGLRGFVSGSGGSANGFGSGSAGFELGHKEWLIWGGGSGQSSGDYSTPIGKIPNSDTRLWSGDAGFGRYGDKQFFSASAEYNKGRYGVPFAHTFEAHGGHGDDVGDHDDEDHGEEDHDAEEEHGPEADRIELATNREAYQFNWGVRNLSRALDQFVLRANFTRWRHNEIEVLEDGQQHVGTRFNNKQFIYRGQFEQARRSHWSGRFGFWGMARAYNATGDEALAPAVDQQGLAGFALEELDFERVKFQFGGRVEYARYAPGNLLRDGESLQFRNRSFTGASGAAGINVGLWQGGAFVANYARSYRPPALEELYNDGPHVGNLAWEIGNQNLGAETGNGIDLSLRHQTERVQAEANFFYYDFGGFVFPFSTGEVESGLQVHEFAQADSRFVGSEATASVRLVHGVWLNAGADYVNAEEKGSGTPLPRIPPLRGRTGLEFNYRGFIVRPELVLVNRQDRTFTGETPTAGYGLFNIRATYSIARGHLVHQFAVNTFNLSDQLYRNHSSFIKELAPEIGRGVRFTYRVRFF